MGDVGVSPVHPTGRTCSLTYEYRGPVLSTSFTNHRDRGTQTVGTRVWYYSWRSPEGACPDPLRLLPALREGVRAVSLVRSLLRLYLATVTDLTYRIHRPYPRDIVHFSASTRTFPPGIRAARGARSRSYDGLAFNR